MRKTFATKKMNNTDFHSMACVKQKNIEIWKLLELWIKPTSCGWVKVNLWGKARPDFTIIIR